MVVMFVNKVIVYHEQAILHHHQCILQVKSENVSKTYIVNIVMVVHESTHIVIKEFSKWNVKRDYNII